MGKSNCLTAANQRMLIDVIQTCIYDNETSTYLMPQKFFVRYNKLDEGSTDWYDINLLRHKSPSGDRIQTSINGELCVDLVDPDGAARGMIGLQVHSGDPTEVRFRDFQLESLLLLNAFSNAR